MCIVIFVFSSIIITVPAVNGFYVTGWAFHTVDRQMAEMRILHLLHPGLHALERTVQGICVGPSSETKVVLLTPSSKA